MNTSLDAHQSNIHEIIKALSSKNVKEGTSTPRYLDSEQAKKYHKYIYDKFKDIINIPSLKYVSKVSDGWLIVGDNRAEVSAKIALIIERYGLGVGMMVLHGQQMNSQYILTEVMEHGEIQTLLKPTEMHYGKNKERILHVPIRKYRGDTEKLSELNIAKPCKLWEQSRIVRHKDDKKAKFCYYCSAPEINPTEVVVDISGKRLGLSRNYSLGYTYAPFGNPLSVMHFLAWDHSSNPLDMSRTPMTVSDLVEMTRLINITIRIFFGGTEITDFPVIDGVSNGWAGNSIYHQHFQFFQPEYESPIVDKFLVSKRPLVERDDIRINKLSWPTPVYMVTADDSINVGLVGNDMAGIWRLQGIKNANRATHTQNIYITGEELGKKAFIILRDRDKVDFEPSDTQYVDDKKQKKAQGKKNIGVLEASGVIIVDNDASFQEMGAWEPLEISEQVKLLATAIAPEEEKVTHFEYTIKTLFP